MTETDFISMALTVIATILGSIAVMLAILHWRGERSIKESIKILLGEKTYNALPSLPTTLSVGKITVIIGRSRVISAVSDMFNRAQKGDVVFGACRNCMNLENDFFGNLVTAISRGAKPEILIPMNRSNVEFVRRAIQIDGMEIRDGDMGNLRLIGILNKEVVLAFAQGNDGTYLGLHVPEKGITNDIYLSFKETFSQSPIITQSDIDGMNS